MELIARRLVTFLRRKLCWLQVDWNITVMCSPTGFRFRYSFIYQGISTRRQRSDLFGLRVKLPPITTSLTTGGVVVVLPDPFRGMGAWRNSTETQQLVHAPRSGPEV